MAADGEDQGGARDLVGDDPGVDAEDLADRFLGDDGARPGLREDRAVFLAATKAHHLYGSISFLPGGDEDAIAALDDFEKALASL